MSDYSFCLLKQTKLCFCQPVNFILWSDPKPTSSFLILPVRDTKINPFMLYKSVWNKHALKSDVRTAQSSRLTWARCFSTGVLFARQSPIAGMAGHHGKHHGCQTQGRSSPTKFQPSSSSSSSSSSLHGHRNTSPWPSTSSHLPLQSQWEEPCY